MRKKAVCNHKAFILGLVVGIGSTMVIGNSVSAKQIVDDLKEVFAK